MSKGLHLFLRFVLLLSLLLSTSSCSHKGDSDETSPAGIESWSCSYAKDIIEEATNLGIFVSRNQKYKNFELYDVYVAEDITSSSAPDVYDPYDGKLPPKYKFYPTLKEVNYSYKDLAQLKKLANVPSKNEDAKIKELTTKNKNYYHYKRQVYGYNFIDTGSNHCDVEVFEYSPFPGNHRFFYRLSDVQEPFSLNKLFSKRCKTKYELIPVSDKNVILKQESYAENCIYGYVKLTSDSIAPPFVDERCGTSAEYLTLTFSDDNVDESVSILDRNLSEVSKYSCTNVDR